MRVKSEPNQGGQPSAGRAPASSAPRGLRRALLFSAVVAAELLGMALAALSPRAYRDYAMLTDSHPIGVALECALLIWATVALLPRFSPELYTTALSSPRLNRSLIWGVVVIAASYIGFARLPWLLAQVETASRVTLTTAQLSAMPFGMPLLAFWLCLNLAWLATAAAVLLLAALEGLGALDNPTTSHRIRGALLLATVSLTLLACAGVLGLATGSGG